MTSGEVASATGEIELDFSDREEENGLLPNELLVLVFARLPVATLNRCRLGCRLWNLLISKFEHGIWGPLLLRDFGAEKTSGGLSPLLSYRVHDNMRKARFTTRLIVDSDRFDEVYESEERDFSSAWAGEDDFDELLGPHGGSKRSVTSSGQTTHNNSPQYRATKRLKQASELPDASDALLKDLLQLADTKGHVWHKKSSFMAWPADPGDAYLIVLENDFCFYLDPQRPIALSVFDLKDTREHRIGGNRVLPAVAVLPNPPPVPESAFLSAEGHTPMIGLILGTGTGACVSFDEISQIAVWDCGRNPEPEFKLRLIIAAGPILGQAIFSMNVNEDFVICAGRFGQVVVFSTRTGDSLYSFDIPGPYRYREPQAPPPAPTVAQIAQPVEVGQLAAAVAGVEPAGEQQPLIAAAPLDAAPVQPLQNLMNVAMNGDKVAVAVYDGSWWVWELPQNNPSVAPEPPSPKRASVESIVRRGRARILPAAVENVAETVEDFPPELPVLTPWNPEHGAMADAAEQPHRYAPETLAMTSHVLLTNGPDRESIGLWDLSAVADIEEAESGPKPRCSRLSVSELLKEHCNPTLANRFVSDIRFAEISMLNPERPTIVASIKARREFVQQGGTDPIHALAVWDFGVTEDGNGTKTTNKWEKIGLLPDTGHEQTVNPADVFWTWVGFSCEAGEA